MHHLTTEQANPDSVAIDTLSSLEIVRLMNAEDCSVAVAVAQVLPAIATAVDRIAERLAKGGRLFYLGAGTSGRLGVLDAAECPPTFSTRPEQIVGVIAGGYTALTRAVEGAEDNEQAAVDDLQPYGLSGLDVLVGIATSGRTPYVIRGLAFAKERQAYTIGLSCNLASELESRVDLAISPIVGPEVISGSTRLKAGTATKMVLNMLTTAAMVKLGKTYGHWMVDLRATNHKLKLRSIRMVASIAKIDEPQAEALLQKCDGEVKTAIVVQLGGVSPDAARDLLAKHEGKLRTTLMARSPRCEPGEGAKDIS
jgi:N-acetylmuramic acid 6-phosphate etherase